MKKMILLGMTALATCILLVMGCSNSTSPSGTGRLRLTLIDSPAAYDSINIVVTRVEVHRAGMDSLSGWEVVRWDTTTYDLLTLRNGANALLGDTMLDNGQYTQIRLSIGDSSNIVVDGVRYDLDISANGTVKLNHTFTIEPNQLYDLTLDFDANHSIVRTGNGQYKLKPVIRVVANIVSGTISGAVSPASAQSLVSTISGIDTIGTYCDTTTGAFVLAALLAGTYDITIVPSDTTYLDSTLTGLTVTAGHDTNIGTVVLRPR